MSRYGILSRRDGYAYGSFDAATPTEAVQKMLDLHYPGRRFVIQMVEPQDRDAQWDVHVVPRDFEVRNGQDYFTIKDIKASPYAATLAAANVH
jgi:hypothetical protein